MPPTARTTRSDRTGRSGRRRGIVALVGAVTASLATVAAPAPAGAVITTGPITARASVTSAGAQIAAPSKVASNVEVDTNGRHVLFTTSAALLPEDTNATYDVYERDLRSATVRLVTATKAGAPRFPADAFLCGASSNGRFVGVYAPAPGKTSGLDTQVWLLDRAQGTAEVVSVTSSEALSGIPGDSDIAGSGDCPVSDDGRYVAFVSSAANLSPNGFAQVLRRDRTAGTTSIASTSTALLVGAGNSTQPSMSEDGDRIVFQSGAPGLVAGDTNGTSDVFVRSMAAGTTTRASLRDDDAQITGGTSNEGAIAGGGRYVAFVSNGTGITADQEEASYAIFVRDLVANSTELVSKTTSGIQGDGVSATPAISDDGRFVAFNSTSLNLYPAKSNPALLDTFLRDRTAGTTALASRTSGIASGDDTSQGTVAVSDGGETVAFSSRAKNLVRNDTNGQADVFVRQFALDRAPFGSYDALVAQQFLDFAGRAPTAAEAAEWKARVVNGEHSPDSLILALAHSSAFSGKRAPLIRLYWAFFLRAPDQGGLDYWTKKLSSGSSLASVAKQFAASSEFQTKYGALVNADFVTKIYQNIFDRAPDPGGLAYWTKKLDTKQKTRGDVMVSFSESSEGQRRLAPQTDSVLLYVGMLRRMPHPDELGEAAAHIQLGGVAADVATYLRGKADYAARVTA